EVEDKRRVLRTRRGARVEQGPELEMLAAREIEAAAAQHCANAAESLLPPRQPGCPLILARRSVVPAHLVERQKREPEYRFVHLEARSGEPKQRIDAAPRHRETRAARCLHVRLPNERGRIPLLEGCAAELVAQRRAVGGQAAPVPGLVAEGNRRPAPGVEGFDVRLPLIARGELRMTARDLAEHRQARRRLRVAEW